MLLVNLKISNGLATGTVHVDDVLVIEVISGVVFVLRSEKVKGNELVSEVADLVGVLVRAAGEVGYASV